MIKRSLFILFTVMVLLFDSVEAAEYDIKAFYFTQRFAYALNDRSQIILSPCVNKPIHTFRIFDSIESVCSVNIRRRDDVPSVPFGYVPGFIERREVAEVDSPHRSGDIGGRQNNPSNRFRY